MKKFLLSALAVAGSLCIANAQTDDNVRVLIDSDFSVFTDGSEESPKSIYSSTFNSKCPGYYMISGVSDAGGKILLDPSGYLTLKNFENLPSAGGTIRVTAEVKMIDEYGGAISFTRGYLSDVVNVAVESTDWTTVTVYCGGYTNTTSSRLKVQPFLSVSGFYLKSLKVEYSPDFIAAPEAYLPNDADGTQFTASCSRVAGAAGYEADVFSIGANDEPVYFQQNVELKAVSAYSDPSAKITGLDPATTYYYVARALNANGKKSENSEVVEVIKKLTSIDAPVALDPTNVTETGFTANWNAVENAKSYIVYTYEKTKLEQAAEASVFAEDFSGVNIGTITSIALTGNIDDFTKVPGWTTDFSKAFAAGYFVFYPTTSGALTTPTIDLSANDGKCTVTLKGFTGSYGNMAATTNTIGAELLVGGNVVETATTLVCDKAAPADFVFNFTKGAADSRIRFTYTLVDGSGERLYVDEINVTQLLPAGTVIENLIGNKSVEGTSADIELTPEEGKTYGYYVVAVGETVTGSGATAGVSELLSKESNHVDVTFATNAIEGIVDDADAPVEWYTLQGVKVAEPAAPGIYIRRQGTKTTKVIL